MSSERLMYVQCMSCVYWVRCLTVQKIELSVKGFDSFLRIYSYLLKKPLKENLILPTVYIPIFIVLQAET